MPEYESISELAAALEEWLRTCSNEERAHFYAEQEKARQEAMNGPDARFFFYEDYAHPPKRPVRRR